MSREITLNNTKRLTFSEVLIKELLIAIAIGITYYYAAHFDPFAATTGLANLLAGHIKLANILKAFILISPGAAIGIAGSNLALLVDSGKIAIPSYLILQPIVLLLGLGTYALSKKIGRSTIKDITLIVMYALISGFIIKLNLVSIALLFDNATWGKALQLAVLTKILVNIPIMLVGYGFIRVSERITK